MMGSLVDYRNMVHQKRIQKGNYQIFELGHDSISRN
jgi:hypothetical protein